MVIAYLDIVWSALALFHDYDKLLSISWYLYPIVLICPIFPLLLALVFFQTTKKRPINQFLLSFAAIPSAVFGVLALLFYPMLMINEGFNILGLGQILWVLFYGAQGWYLIFRYKMKSWVLVVVSIYLIAKLTLDYYYLSFGYISVEKLTQSQLLGLYIGALVAVALVNIVIFRRDYSLNPK